MELKLKSLRKSRNLSQKDIAERIGVKVRTYASWERQENKITLEYAYQISEILNVSLDNMCNRTKKGEIINKIQDINIRRLITNYNQLSEEVQYQLLAISRSLVNNPSNRNHQ